MNLTVVQRPAAVTYTCADCGEEISIRYKEFCEEHSYSLYEWQNVELKCPECGSLDCVDDFEFE